MTKVLRKTERFEFEAVLKNGTNGGVYADFPFDCKTIFGTGKAIPVKVEIEGKYTGEMSLLPCGNGKHWLHLRKEIRLAVGKEEGDTVSVVLEKNTNPITPDVPDYLQWLLEDDPAILNAFQKMPLSARKFWIGYIEETKKADIKVEKINRFFEFLKSHYLR